MRTAAAYAQPRSLVMTASANVRANAETEVLKESVSVLGEGLFATRPYQEPTKPTNRSTADGIGSWIGRHSSSIAD